MKNQPKALPDHPGSGGDFYYGIHREYRFEAAMITIGFLTLVIAGALLSAFFRRAAQGKSV